VSFAPDRAPEPGCLCVLSLCALRLRPHCHSATAVSLAARLCLAAFLRLLCGLWRVGEREQRRLDCAAPALRLHVFLGLTLVPCLNTTLHAGRRRTPPSQSSPCPWNEPPPFPALFSWLHPTSASLRQWRRRLHLLPAPWCCHSCCCSSSPPLAALSSPPRASTLKVPPSFLCFFLCFVGYVALSFYSSTSFYLCSVCLKSNRCF
jgi:drug/metabolite transporter (DMT)-like permease